MSRRTETDLKAIEKKKEKNKVRRNGIMRSRQEAKKAYDKLSKGGTAPRTKHNHKGEDGRHMAILMNRTSKYPIEFSMATHNVCLNPLKRLTKNKPYKNTEYQQTYEKIIRDYMMKAQEEQKAILEQQKAQEATSGKEVQEAAAQA